MRFESIKTYKKSWGEYAIQEHIDNLVNDFGAKSWHVCYGYKFSMVERFLTEGNARPNYEYDFGCFNDAAIDHAAFIKRMDGKTFILTMPYADNDLFHKWFNELLSDYQAEKFKIRARIEDGYGGNYRHKACKRQIYSDVDIQAVVVDNRYKIRVNGDMAAIIATTETLRVMGLCE